MKILASMVLASTLSFAHFQTLIPTNDNAQSGKTTLNMKFMHPFEGHTMNMPKPKNIGVFVDGKKEILNKSLGIDNVGWKFDYTFKDAGSYTFFVEPDFYFEKAENVSIAHYAKVCVDVAGANEGWEKPIGLPAEIIPYVKPFGLYVGNSFNAQVLYKGKPAKNVKVEIEFLNDKKLKAPTQNHITQEVITDSQGFFNYTLPFDGWWGFNAIIDEPKKEIGATYWIKAYKVK